MKRVTGTGGVFFKATDPVGLREWYKTHLGIDVQDWGLVAVLREEGCTVLENDEDSDFGKFAWVIDPEGNKVELWEPPAGQ